MQFIKLTSLVALVGTALAIPIAQGGNAFTTENLVSVTAGAGTTITWVPTSGGTVSLVLMKGQSWNLEPVGTVASGIANSGSFWWTPEVKGDGYAIKIVADDNENNYNFTPLFSVY